MYYEPIAKAVRHYKCEGGQKEMCELVEQYREQGKLEGIDLGKQEGERIGEQRATLKTLASLVQQNLITIECASMQMNITVDDFIQNAKQLNINLVH